MIRLPLAVLTALTALVLAAPAGAVAPPDERPLRNIDVRKADGGPVTATERRGRVALERSLGDEGVVSTDRISGGARLVARTDGFLTGRRSAPPADVALDYVRARPDVFGLEAADLDGLRLTSRYRSPDGVTHLAYTQTYLGVAAYDNVLLANVDEDGRLLNVGGAAISDLRVPSVTPGLDAEAALAAAKQEVGGSLVPPRARQGLGRERPTRFSNGDRAGLTIFSDGSNDRLAWLIQVTGAHEFLYEVVIDATNGAVLKRRSLTEFTSDALVHEYYPGAPSGGMAQTVDLDADQAWLDRSSGGTRLAGNNAHAYVDDDGTDGFTSTGEDIPSESANWVFPQTLFDVPDQACPLVGGELGCTWDSTAGNEASKAANRAQATTQLFYLVNTFHDHLEALPIGFTPAARSFEFTDIPGQGEGGDPLLAEANDFDDVNNASMTTPADGAPPKMQMYLFDDPSLNAADAADVVYHEYAHGLTSRSVGTGVGISALQSRALGEGWSDWYALDFLAGPGQGHITDTAAHGEVNIGTYLEPGGFRRQGADCPVGSPSPECPGMPGAGAGGFTLGDIGNFPAGGSFVHDNGEIWLETLWDLRTALGGATARELITSGLRLAPDNPSFLEARDAIIQADQVLGGANYAALWAVFAARGMGQSASTRSASATTAQEAFDLPPLLLHDSSTVTDPAPGGDGDGVAEPGETVRLSETLRNMNPFPVGDVSGQLTSGTPGVVAVQPNATWPSFAAAGSTRTGTPAFDVAIPSSVSCGGDVQLGLALSTDRGSFSVPLQLPVGRRPSADVPKVVASSAGVSSELTFGGSGPVQDLEVHISKLTHTWVGDVVVTLRSPAGTTVTLMNSPGPGELGASGDDFVDLLLADDAAATIESIPDSPPSGGYTGRYRPDEPLSAFDGQERRGTWTLHVSDGFPAVDSGTLHDWALRPSGCSGSSNVPPPVPPPPPPPPPPSPPPPAVVPRAPAKLEVLRAGVRDGKLDGLARITARASGRVKLRYLSSGRTTRFTVPITRGTIRFARRLPAAQRRKPTGIFTLTYDGSTTVQPDGVRLRAATGKARLVRRTARIDGGGRLRVSGSITPRARGVVRIRLGTIAAEGSGEFLRYTARIKRGAWSLTTRLPRAAATAGGQLSIQFTGYEPRRIRGEQIAKEVKPGG